MKTLKSLFALSVLLIANSAFAGNPAAKTTNTGDKNCCTLPTHTGLIEMIEADAAAEVDEPLFIVNTANLALIEMIEADAAAEADEPLLVTSAANTGLIEMIEADAAAEVNEPLFIVNPMNAGLIEMIEADAEAEANIGLIEGIDFRPGSSDELIRMIENNAVAEVEEVVL